ncbi:hypothetical protein FRB94_004916 [Tulasnella sp. JGI-2019a]|nr:hypothetical protein FRB94_004916 [Tulasnella sp. JGI-2019a]
MISERLAGDPGSASLLYGLYAGPQNPAPPREYTVHRTVEKNMIDNYLTFETVVDMPRIDVITSYNSFVPSPPSGVEEVEKSPEGAGGYTNTASALFTLPSLFNHSCAPNTHIFCLGDVMVVRAASHIAKDTELFICYDPQGETYISRNKSGVVARLVPNCDCILCSLDKADGEVACRKREEIVKGIPSWNSVEIAHAGIRKLEKTYNKGTPMGMRGAMFKATWQLATLLLEKKDHAGFLQQGLKMLDYLGMKMRSMEHGAKSKRHARRNSLPVERTSVNPISASISWDNIIIACLFMADALIHPLENRERAETWLRSVWKFMIRGGEADRPSS